MVALAYPTYWANVPAIVKNMFDRLLGVALEETKSFPKPRLSKRQKYILITVCNTPFPFSFSCGQSSGAIRSIKVFFKTAGIKYKRKVVLTKAEKNYKLTRKVKIQISRCLS